MTNDSLTMFLQEALDRRDVFPGGILVPQTFGGMANWNPNVHALITDTCWDREGNYYPMPGIDTSNVQGIEKLFASLVFKMLLEENMISEELVENMNSWKHSGFSVHCGKPVKADDINGRKTLSEYISRAPFSLERMSFNKDSKTVVYRGEHFHPTLARNFDVSDPLEWIARVTSHMLPPPPQMIDSHVPEDSCGLCF
jgi:hypothetical protein